MPRTRNTSRLTHKQERFVEEYLVDLNASAAALRAGYKPSAAGWMGSKNLRTPLIKKAIDAKRARVTARLEVSAARTLEELAKIAYHELRPQKITAPDKLSALDKIARHLGMFRDRLEHTGPDGGPIVTTELSDIERLQRVLAILARAGQSGIGSDFDGGSANLDSADGRDRPDKADTSEPGV